jgi:drug/metabolite transporter (DMT)-like permease
MTGLALALVIVSAFFHATWNMLAKRSNGGVAFVWLFSTLMSLFYAPLALAALIITRPTFDLIDGIFIVGSSGLHVVYYLLLSYGYRQGDLSLVYPLARGTGPMLATVGAIILLDERPTTLGLVGIVCIGIGIFILAGGIHNFRKQEARSKIRIALSIGVLISMYTLWDKYAMSVLLISPLIFEWSMNFLRALFLTGLVRSRWDEAKMEWRTHRVEAIGVGILSPLAYILVLTAMRVAPVSYIAPLREVSILIGAVMGTVLLAERDALHRWPGAVIMVIGVICLSLGG